MSISITETPRAEKRRLKRMMNKTKDAKLYRRAQAITLLLQGHKLIEVHRMTDAARSTIKRWQYTFEAYGVAGLEIDKPGRRAWTVT